MRRERTWPPPHALLVVEDAHRFVPYHPIVLEVALNLHVPVEVKRAGGGRGEYRPCRDPRACAARHAHVHLSLSHEFLPHVASCGPPPYRGQYGENVSTLTPNKVAISLPN